jgi:hypothetical protein
MQGLSLRQAAIEAGTSKSTILRAIQAGRLSATRTDDGGYAIQPAELFRVYAPKAERSTDPEPVQDATALIIAKAELEANIKALQELLAAERERRISVERERDRWADQADQSGRLAQRLALPAPEPVRDVPAGLFTRIRRALG